MPEQGAPLFLARARMIEEFCFVAEVFRIPVLFGSSFFKFSQELWMLQKALVLVFAVASIAICTGCGNTANQYVYATLPVSNQVIAYREDPNSGVLTLISGSPYAAGDGANSLVLHPSGNFLYVSNPGQGENDISLFDIAGDGVLTEVLPRTSVAPYTQPEFLAMDPAGNYLYVANALSYNISVFSIDSSSGMLTPAAIGAFSTQLPPLNMKLTPSGSYLYVSASGQPGLIEGFSVTAGVLQSIGVTQTDGPNPDGLAIDPSGAHLYVGNSSSPGSSISVFTIDSSGGLAEVQGSPINDSYTNPLSLTLDPSGSLLYVANQGSSNVAVYTISSTTGLPTILSNSTTTGAFTTEANPSFLAVDPSGKYLFVGNQGSSSAIQSFEVNSGNLTEIFTYNVGNTPSSIAVLGSAPSTSKSGK